MTDPVIVDSPPPHRGAVPGLRSPFPLRTQMPGMLQDDPMVVQFVDALDEVIAPVISVLDSFDAYLDPHLAPVDMVRYMGEWVLASMDDVWTESTLRRDVSRASFRAKWAGTAAALSDRLLPEEVSSMTITDSGTTMVSTEPTDPESWSEPSDMTVVVTVRPRTPGEAELERIARIARTVVPAHVSLSVVNG